MGASPEETLRLRYDDVCTVLASCLRARGFEHERARRCATIFADNTVVGVASHGLNRFPRFLEWIDRGWVDPKARPERVSSLGGLEQWDGHLGPGPLNAQDVMERATELAAEHGVGCVALRNTNHWMRAGTYAWQAAEAGFLALCFTNTVPNLPPWGGTRPAVGNNPIALAIPRANGRHLLFDGALSQFSYGAMEDAARRGEELSVPGGFDCDGRLSTDPAKILASRRALPIGYWKGAGLALMVDLLVTVLACGRSTRQLGLQDAEYGVSQTFLVFHSRAEGGAVSDEVEATIEELRDTSAPHGGTVRYPGERLTRVREENSELGVPVEPSVWEAIRAETREP